MITRREIIRLTGAGTCISVAGCMSFDESGEDPSSGERTKMHVIEIEGGGTAPATFLWGIQEGTWRNHGIDLSFEAAPFPRFSRQVVDGEAEVGSGGTIPNLEFMQEGEELTLVGQQLTMYNRLFSHADDDTIEDPTDLAGKDVGMPASLTSSTSLTLKAMILDEYGFDIVDDTASTTASPPPALWELFKGGELDAVGQFDGYTLRGMDDDDVKTIFDPYEYWLDREGERISTATFATRPDFLQNNPELVRNFLNGWSDAVTSVQQNAEEVFNSYGTIAGITEEEQDTAIRILDEEPEMIYGEVPYSEETIDADYRFFQLLEEYDILEVSEREAIFTSASDLDSLVD